MTEPAEPDFEVIVIGAGVAGCVAAYQLARQGRSVLLIERGEAPGSKNLSGGVLYSRGIQQVFPGFLDQAPVERRITRNYINFLNADSSVAIDYKDARLADPVNAVTVLRAKLDGWLAAQCEEAGALLMPGVRVDRVLTEQGRVSGVQAGDDELRSKVVIAADGVNSFISKEAGLREKEPLKDLAVGVKSVISLPRETIEARFNLTGDEGAAFAVVGDCTEGVGGGGFLYTNIDSLSVGIVVRLDDLTAKKKVVTDIFDHFLEHRFIAPYLEGGELLEYGCHLVAEGGLHMIGEIVTDGMVVIGDAAGLTLNTGLTVRGMDLAVGSAVAAAEAVGAALDAKDTSKAALAGYRERLFASYVGQDMKTYARAPSFLEVERMYKQYGELLANVLYGAFNLDTRPRQHMVKVARKSLARSPLKMRQLIRDGIAGARAL
ncbi:MAG TPA: FAD-dependent oxidoreductase [Streptosporangiaceae bacterium]|nr:FAD-dependent oxidoreductase [Streptosporangiaceae bacterium]